MESVYSCQSCAFVSTYHNVIKRHFRLWHQPRDRVYSCPICDALGKSFSVNIKYEYKVHVDTYHRGENNKIVCPQSDCKYKHKSVHDVSRHLKGFHYKIRHQCNQCPRNFAYKTVLNMHRRARHEGRPLFCDQCDYQAQQLSGLKRHVNSVHLRLKPYHCQHCKWKFAQKQHLKKHFRVCAKSVQFLNNKV